VDSTIRVDFRSKNPSTITSVFGATTVTTRGSCGEPGSRVAYLATVAATVRPRPQPRPASAPVALACFRCSLVGISPARSAAFSSPRARQVPPRQRRGPARASAHPSASSTTRGVAPASRVETNTSPRRPAGTFGDVLQLRGTRPRRYRLVANRGTERPTGARQTSSFESTAQPHSFANPS